jgi:hypothetical protein
VIRLHYQRHYEELKPLNNYTLLYFNIPYTSPITLKGFMQKYKHKSKKEMNTTETVAKPTLQQIHHVGINSCYNKYQVNGTPNL